MGKKILFSPVGGTDPIKYCRDGSMLHISRIYKPDVVHLYMSHEMLENHRKDNRYCDSLERLGELLDHHFEICVIEREELIDVQQYDVFYRDFREIIRSIERSMQHDDELIINMASGTPAMKSALLIIATLAEYRFQPIQVSTPLKRLNADYENREDYDVKINWELNEDNAENFPNRCKEIQCVNLMKLLKIDMIKKHIGAYDYTAALSVAREIKEEISEDAFTLLQIADARVKLNRSMISKLNAGNKYNIFPVTTGKGQKLFEYALVLQMKVAKEEYADFIRGITPIVVDLLEDILKMHCKLSLTDYCTQDPKGVFRWDEEKLQQSELLEILDREYGRFRFGPVYSIHIATLIRNKCSNRQLIQKVKEMIEIEQAVRNVAAHEIVSVTDEWFREKTGKSAKEILSVIKYLIGMAGLKVEKSSWDSYDKMNQLISEYLY